MREDRAERDPAAPPPRSHGAGAERAASRRPPVCALPFQAKYLSEGFDRAAIEDPRTGLSGTPGNPETTMQRSTDRILTTHAGSLPRPRDLLEMVRTRSRGERVDEDAFQTRLRLAVGEIVRRQADLGVDVVDDGEFGKPSFVTYVRERLGGLTRQEGERQSPWARSREALSFPEFYQRQQAGAVNARQALMACTGPITYRGQNELKTDLDNLKAALKGVDVAEVFVP